MCTDMIEYSSNSSINVKGISPLSTVAEKPFTFVYPTLHWKSPIIIYSEGWTEKEIIRETKP